jgi:hypothetical protein
MTMAGLPSSKYLSQKHSAQLRERSAPQRVSGSFDWFARGNAPIEEPAFHWSASYAERRPEKLACRIVLAAD